MIMADPLLSFLILISSLIQLTNANPRKEVVMLNCKTTTSQNLTQFLQNYEASGGMVKSEVSRNLFGYGSAGVPPNNVYLMAQCHGDLPIADCITCFQESYDFLSAACTPGIGGRVFLDGCFIRAENYSFYNDPSSYSEAFCGTSKGKEDEEQKKFNEVVKQLLDYLVEKTPKNGGFGTMSKKASRKTEVHALAICWKLTDNVACHTCLDNAVKSILRCLPLTEARIATDNCFLRYSDYPFLNPSKDSRIRSSFVPLTSYVLVISIGCMVAISLGVLAGSILHARVHKWQSKVKGIDMDSLLSKRCLTFEYSTLEKATNFFSEMNKLGEGASSIVFKACLADGREVAVKRLFISYKSRSDEIYNELYIVTQAQHKNLVRFLGCCLTNDVTLFVYEYLPLTSLDNFLFDPERKKELDWKKRFKIITGIAEEDKSLTHTPISGTLGYMAPEYMADGQINEKLDVYSFGVLVLEIISSIQNSKFKQDESLDTLVTTAWKHFKSNKVMEIIDEFLEIDDMECVTRVIHVGLLCTQRSPSLRPTMTKVIKMLTQKDMHLPTPSKPPFVCNYNELSLPSVSCKNPSEPSCSCSPHYSDCEA
ncbi:hypothetical protein NE237_006384 [Protea cynaroides]|uniref:Uncharacterized protein n=1 Tax=Protea cynaroides TaxID=273540 RepID=A0A9Q0QV45_9MAGN|nr:hypothetical protein NE237_006384 [Protea cynaroides]